MSIITLGPRYIYHKSTPLSTPRKVVRAAGFAVCGGLSLFVSEPSFVASLSQLSGKVIKRICVGTAASIAGIDWASLGAYGGVECINSLLEDLTEEEKELFKPLFGKFGTGVAITASVVLGLGQRLPTLPEALRFNRAHPDFARSIAATSFFVESWLPSYSMLITINRVFNRKLFEKKLFIAKQSLINWTGNAKKVAIYLSHENKAEKFPILLRQSSNIDEVVKEIWVNGKTEAVEPSCKEKIYSATVYSLKGIVLTSIIGLFLLDALLAKNAVNYFSHSFLLVGLGMALTVLPMLYGAPKIALDGVQETIDMVRDRRLTYGEYVYPVLSKILKITACLCSFMQFFEQKALVNLYLKEGVMNNLLTYSNTLSCGFMITKSYYTIIEAFLYGMALYRKLDGEGYSLIKERADRFEKLLIQTTPQQMLELLDVCDEEIKRDAFDDEQASLLIQA